MARVAVLWSLSTSSERLTDATAAGIPIMSALRFEAARIVEAIANLGYLPQGTNLIGLIFNPITIGLAAIGTALGLAAGRALETEGTSGRLRSAPKRWAHKLWRARRTCRRCMSIFATLVSAPPRRSRLSMNSAFRRSRISATFKTRSCQGNASDRGIGSVLCSGARKEREDHARYCPRADAAELCAVLFLRHHRGRPEDRRDPQILSS